MRNYFLLLGLLFVLVFFSCEKEDSSAEKLHGKDGVWTIESIEYLGYDSTGNVLYDSTIVLPGELIFFATGSLNALYGYYQGVYLDFKTNGGSVMEYMVDGNRAHIQDIAPIDPLGLAKIWTQTKNGKRNQEWTYVSIKNAAFSINEKVILKLKAKNAF